MGFHLNHYFSTLTGKVRCRFTKAPGFLRSTELLPRIGAGWDILVDLFPSFMFFVEKFHTDTFIYEWFDRMFILLHRSGGRRGLGAHVSIKQLATFILWHLLLNGGKFPTFYGAGVGGSKSPRTLNDLRYFINRWFCIKAARLGTVGTSRRLSRQKNKVITNVCELGNSVVRSVGSSRQHALRGCKLSTPTGFIARARYYLTTCPGASNLTNNSLHRVKTTPGGWGLSRNLRLPGRGTAYLVSTANMYNHAKLVLMRTAIRDLVLKPFTAENYRVV